MNETMTTDQFHALLGKRKDFAPPAKRSRSEPDGMNGTERKMAAELAIEHAAGTIRWWAFEAVNLKLADKTWYRPDFVIWHADGHIECRETKGHWEDDARAKFKIAAELFRAFKFTAYKPLKGGGWDIEEL